MDYNLILGVLAVLLVLYLIYCYMQKPATPPVAGFAVQNKRAKNTKPRVINVGTPQPQVKTAGVARRNTSQVRSRVPVNAYRPNAIISVPKMKYGNTVYSGVSTINNNTYNAKIKTALSIVTVEKTKNKNKKKSKFEDMDAGLWLAQRGIGNIASTFEGGDEPVSNANVDMKPVDFVRDRTNPDLQPINRYYLQY